MLSKRTSDVLSSSGWLTILLTVLLGILVLRILLTRRKRVPPGPRGVPFLGYFPFLTRTPYKKLRDLSETYGDVMSLSVVGTPVIHLGSYDAVREAFVTQGNEFSGRPEGFSFFRWILNNIGIVQSEGEEWKEHRRFALHTLRDFGFGKTSLETRIQQIAQDVIVVVEESKGKPMDMQELLANSTSNVICSLLFDKHFKTDDPVFQKIRHSIKELFNRLPGVNVFLNGPLVKYLPLKYVPGGKVLMEVKKTFYEIVTELIKEHLESFDPTFLRDYVDAFLDEMRKIEAAGTTDTSTYTIERLKAVCLNLFIAGTESTANTLYWALRILMFRPDIQRKIQLEIEDVIGKDRYPSVMDRHHMPYTEAVINEVLRVSSLAPLGIFHSNPEEVKFQNFTIPKRSVIIANLWALHHDPKYWPEPEKFDPLRFLNADGKLERRDSFYPFSAGKRLCLGETLARTELFIFLVSILQKYMIQPPDGDTDPTVMLNNTFLRTVQPFEICAIKLH